MTAKVCKGVRSVPGPPQSCYLDVSLGAMVAGCPARHGTQISAVAESACRRVPPIFLLFVTAANMAAEAFSWTFRMHADLIDFYVLHTPSVADVSGLHEEHVQVQSRDLVPDSPVAHGGRNSG